METAIESKAKLRAILAGKVKFAYVFGSAVTGRLGPESDIDIGLFPDDAYAGKDARWTLRDLFLDQFERSVDVVFLDSADPIIRYQVLANGEELLVEDRGVLNLFKAEAMSRYIDFKKSREYLEKHLVDHPVLKKGNPHGP